MYRILLLVALACLTYTNLSFAGHAFSCVTLDHILGDPDIQPSCAFPPCQPTADPGDNVFNIPSSARGDWSFTVTTLSGWSSVYNDAAEYTWLIVSLNDGITDVPFLEQQLDRNDMLAGPYIIDFGADQLSGALSSLGPNPVNVRITVKLESRLADESPGAVRSTSCEPDFSFVFEHYSNDNTFTPDYLNLVIPSEPLTPASTDPINNPTLDPYENNSIKYADLTGVGGWADIDDMLNNRNPFEPMLLGYGGYRYLTMNVPSINDGSFLYGGVDVDDFYGLSALDFTAKSLDFGPGDSTDENYIIDLWKSTFIDPPYEEFVAGTDRFLPLSSDIFSFDFDLLLDAFSLNLVRPFYWTDSTNNDSLNQTDTIELEFTLDSYRSDDIINVYANTDIADCPSFTSGYDLATFNMSAPEVSCSGATCSVALQLQHFTAFDGLGTDDCDAGADVTFSLEVTTFGHTDELFLKRTTDSFGNSKIYWDYPVVFDPDGSLGSINPADLGTKVQGDFDGDDRPDYFLHRPMDQVNPADPFRYFAGSYEKARTPGAPPQQTYLGWPIGEAIQGDFDNDGHADFALVFEFYRGWYGWFIATGTDPVGFSDIVLDALIWGTNRDKIITGDFNGDGYDDLVAARAGTWYVRSLNPGFPGISSFVVAPNAAAEDILLSGNLDGSGADDAIVYRPSTGIWYICERSGAGDCTSRYQVQWFANVKPVIGNITDELDGIDEIGFWEVNNPNCPQVVKLSYPNIDVNSTVNNLLSNTSSECIWVSPVDYDFNLIEGLQIQDYNKDGVDDFTVIVNKQPSGQKWWLHDFRNGEYLEESFGWAIDKVVTNTLP